MLRRMRWLFLSIMVIYLWFTPGQVLLPVAGVLSPSLEGLRLGLYRVFSLVFIVLAVNLFIKSISRDELIGGILWLLHPLKIFRLPDERLALRIALTFEVVQEVQGLYGNRSQTHNEGHGEPQSDLTTTFSGRLRHRLWSSGESAVRLFQQVCDKAEHMPCHDVVIPVEGMPPVYQWCYPVMLAMACYWLHGTSIV